MTPVWVKGHIRVGISESHYGANQAICTSECAVILTIKNVFLQVLLPLLNKCSVVMDDEIMGSALFTASTTRLGTGAVHGHTCIHVYCLLSVSWCPY